jgi:hypothetical protein
MHNFLGAFLVTIVLGVISALITLIANKKK